MLINFWRFPSLGFAIVLIIFGTSKAKDFPRVARRVQIAGVIELTVGVLSWVAWDAFLRMRSRNFAQWGFAGFNAGLSLLGLAGYATLLTAVFLDRSPQMHFQVGDPHMDPRYQYPQMPIHQMPIHQMPNPQMPIHQVPTPQMPQPQPKSTLDLPFQ